jgi:hypothetical protein
MDTEMDKLNKDNIESALIVSVESRKGGVGKTTAALRLCKLLQKDDYAVLMLDLDVTGTNAADFAESPFWSGDLHVIPDPDRKIGANQKSFPANLLSLFDQCYMMGKEIPNFSLEDQNRRDLVIDLEKINLLGSQIYRTDVEELNEHNESKNPKILCVEKPQILFDNLHSLWFLEFVNHLIDNFIAIVRDKFCKIAVVLDNSPGYVGFAPVIQDWLTDRGPKDSKFLMVTSLDAQDLVATERGIELLHKLYEDKWHTSQLFRTAKTNGSGIHVKKDQESFFFRLATTAAEARNTNDPLSFYRKVQGNDKVINSSSDGEQYCEHLEEYISVIVNRIPRSIKQREWAFEFPEQLAHDANILRKLLTGGNLKRDPLDRMIAYNEYIAGQFSQLSPYRRRRRGRYELDMSNLIESLNEAERELGSFSERDIFPSGERDIRRFKDSLNRIAVSNEIINRVRAALEDSGWIHLNQLIQSKWLPSSIITEFRTLLGRLLRERDIPFLPNLSLNSLDIENDELFRKPFLHFYAKLWRRLRNSELRSKAILDTRMSEIFGELISRVFISAAMTMRSFPMAEPILAGC